MTDKLQLMLINVRLDQFLNIKVSKGSVATRDSTPGLVFQPRGSGFCDVKPRGPQGPRGPVYTGPVNTEY